MLWLRALPAMGQDPWARGNDLDPQLTGQGFLQVRVGVDIVRPTGRPLLITRCSTWHSGFSKSYLSLLYVGLHHATSIHLWVYGCHTFHTCTISNMIFFCPSCQKKSCTKKTYRWSPKESCRCVKRISRTSSVTEKKKSYIIYIITQWGNEKWGGKDGKRGGENGQRGKIKCADFAS